MDTRITVFSDCRIYRYTLWRTWDMFTPTYLQVIGLNPSTADEIHDDPTIRRCVDYATRWGYGGLCMTNLYAYRATEPQRLLTAVNPVGPDNDRWLATVAADASLVLVAWGAHKMTTYHSRSATVLTFLETRPVVCLGTTASGAPCHPLYRPKTQEPFPYYGRP